MGLFSSLFRRVDAAELQAETVLHGVLDFEGETIKRLDGHVPVVWQERRPRPEPSVPPLS